MALGLLKLQDPTSGHGERRRRVRHTLHTPVYASFSGPHTGMVLDLSELLDLHEDGFSVQASDPLEINRPLNICLDLPETKSYVHASGHVVWSDGRGRGGVSFSGLSEESRRRLKEWLFVNALIACTHQAERSRQRSQQLESPTPPLSLVVEPAAPPAPALEAHVAPAPVPDLSGLLSAVEAVRLEVRALEGNFDAALQLVTERALSLTGANGAALAFSTEGELVCRARAGEQAPPLGARVDARQGLTGECVRSGRLISCEDTEIDPRVDRELCRQLGIGSILAVPIFSDFKVAGLIEVFSPHPHAFAKIHATVLDRLAELFPKEAPPSSPRPAGAGGAGRSGESRTIDLGLSSQALPETETAAQEPLTGVGVRRVHLGLLVLAVAISALGLGYGLAPYIERHWLAKENTQPAVVSASAASPQPKNAPKGNTLAEVRSLAESGDPGAEYELGTRYHYGDGVTQSDPEAVKWFIRAAEQGHVVSQATLGYFYWVGQGVPRDITKAYFWSILARAGGDEASKYRIESLSSNMTRAQALAIQQEAEMWLHEHGGTAQQSQK
jgi:putative methionine-R-sulfoxide reductase with GAF domain